MMINVQHRGTTNVFYPKDLKPDEAIWDGVALYCKIYDKDGWVCFTKNLDLRIIPDINIYGKKVRIEEIKAVEI